MAFVDRGRSTEHLMGMGDRNEGSGWMVVCALDDIVASRGVVDFARVVGKAGLVDLDRHDLVTLDPRLADRCDIEYAF